MSSLQVTHRAATFAKFGLRLADLPHMVADSNLIEFKLLRKETSWPKKRWSSDDPSSQGSSGIHKEVLGFTSIKLMTCYRRKALADILRKVSVQATYAAAL